ncbi:MAG: hypothetical protein N2559_18600, partial [Anaerolineae bacterium]|nr:hypothetical protein [Anaerolineae bacterium]
MKSRVKTRFSPANMPDMLTEPRAMILDKRLAKTPNKLCVMPETLMAPRVMTREGQPVKTPNGDTTMLLR